MMMQDASEQEAKRKKKEDASQKRTEKRSFGLLVLIFHLKGSFD
jgi:hypothetical protein